METGGNMACGKCCEKRQKAHITVHRGGKYTSGILIPVENKNIVVPT